MRCTWDRRPSVQLAGARVVMRVVTAAPLVQAQERSKKLQRVQRRKKRRTVQRLLPRAARWAVQGVARAL